MFLDLQKSYLQLIAADALRCEASAARTVEVVILHLEFVRAVGATMTSGHAVHLKL
jgi:hypothetical protein